jgi:hypothetical protein
MSRKVILRIIWVLLLGCTNTNGELNFEDLKNIKVGMTIDKVHLIMTNDPIALEEAYWSDSILVERYESGFAASDDYRIIYNKADSTVKEIYWGD